MTTWKIQLITSYNLTPWFITGATTPTKIDLSNQDGFCSEVTFLQAWYMPVLNIYPSVSLSSIIWHLSFIFVIIILFPYLDFSHGDYHVRKVPFFISTRNYIGGCVKKKDMGNIR